MAPSHQWRQEGACLVCDLEFDDFEAMAETIDGRG
jgi:hypothetical protein